VDLSAFGSDLKNVKYFSVLIPGLRDRGNALVEPPLGGYGITGALPLDYVFTPEFFSRGGFKNLSFYVRLISSPHSVGVTSPGFPIRFNEILRTHY
jgi:hypothetical protein